MLLRIFCVLFLTASLARAAVEPGDKPAFDWPTLSGAKVSNEQFKNWLLVVVFWSSDDQYTLPEAANINKSFTGYGRRGVRFVGVNLDRDLEVAQESIKAKRLSWPQVADGKGWESPIVKEWQPTKEPQAYILSPEGEVLWTGHPRSMEGTLESAIADHPPTVPREAWLELTLAQLNEINRLLEANKDAQDFREPLRLLGELPDNALDDPKVVAALRRMLRHFDSKKEQDVYSLKGYLEGEPEGAAMLANVRKLLAAPSTQPATQPNKAEQARYNQLAQGKLNAANRFRAGKNHVEAYRHYKQVVDDFPDAPVFKLAEARLQEYEANAEFMAQWKIASKEFEAKDILTAGQAYLRAGKKDLAAECFQRIVDEYPETEAAKKAKLALKAK
jgi:tetratricopeptide (TPR) repeat protein